MDTLFDSAAERMALETGRPLSQTRIEVAFGSVGVSGPLFDEAEELESSFVEEPVPLCVQKGHCEIRADGAHVATAIEPRYEIQISASSFVIAKGEGDLHHSLKNMKEDGIEVLSVRPSTPQCSVHGTPLLLESGGGGKVSCPRCA